MSEDSHTLLMRLHMDLGIAPDYAQQRGLAPFAQAALADLRVLEIDPAGRPLLLCRASLRAWRALRAAAERDGVRFYAFSGFRSYLYQAQLLRRQLDTGRSLEDVLANIAAPGYSEHHTGCALDISCDGCAPLSEAFECTQAFAWLQAHAARFGFDMSFARDNPHGFVYEPWHWCFRS